MRHLVDGKKLGVGPAQRKALVRSLTLSLIEQEKIRTTPARAKVLRRHADKMITLGKKGDLAARRRMLRLLGTNETKKPGENRVRNAIDIVFNSLAPRYKGRNGGYTQTLKLRDRRAGDNAELCVMRFLPETTTSVSGAKKKKKAAKSAITKAAKAAAPKAKAAAEDKPAKKKAKKA